MSVISVVWRDCHQLIESYNEEQVRKAHHVKLSYSRQGTKIPLVRS